MSYTGEFYLVRHGNYDHESGCLNAEGRSIHAPSARDRLLARGLGANTILLSSDAPRAAETAEIIGYGIGAKPILSSVINEAGNDAWSVSDLDAVVDRALLEVDIADDATQDLVVVTHAPMLAIARGVESYDIDFGEVLAYQRGSWNNPDAPK